jgi:acyl-coenzyme A synthetase/AMP-(fatty) acid ligase
VMMRNSIEMVHTWFATMRLGAIWIPINSELKSVTLQHVIESTEAKILIIDPEFFPRCSVDTGIQG